MDIFLPYPYLEGTKDVLCMIGQNCSAMYKNEGIIEMQQHSQVANGAKYHVLMRFEGPLPAQQATEPQAKQEVTEIYSLSLSGGRQI